ncbi:MAG: SDR family NAD(P)-dependent oxidoreductase [Deltaproteobacteria bacterium]|nr:SDR family NAD(P)-dependent oxidoreductase [Deltaproteobacteria bacterium]
MRIEGATTLVTGASSGIGAAVCRALADAGATVALVARRAERLAEIAAALPPGRHATFPCDVRDPAALAAALAAVRARLGDVDVLVNNAGIGRYQPFVETDAEETAAILETNLHAALHLTRAVLPGMLARGRGHVVNVASIAGRIGSRNHAVYCASKFALAGFSESLVYELAGTGVGVTLVNPGIIATPFFDHASFARFPARARRRAIAPAVVAAAIVRAIRRDRIEVTVPAHYAIGTLLKTLAPALFRRLMQRNA